MFDVGDVLADRYEIEGPLGQGGMAHVYAAYDRHLERGVALKVLRPHLTETDAERFRREIRALARLSHPGIVTILDLGTDDVVYFAMERITGGPFTDLGPWEDDAESAERFLRAAITVAETLGYVHELGMVHRDLTPRNVLLTDRGAPKVMDFGLVQLTESDGELTRTGATLGTPQYMAPEQATGATTGAATDLYALGAVLHRTLTGEAAFDADNDQAVLYQHVYGDVASAQDVNPLVPPGLARLVAALLAKDPADRPASGYAVADALRDVAADVAARAAAHPAGGAAATGVHPAGPTGPDAPAVRWRTHLRAGPQGAAGLTARDGRLLVATRGDAVVVLDRYRGSPVATLALPDEAAAPALATAKAVVVASRDGTVSTFAWPDGAHLHRDAEAGAVGIAAVGDDVLVARDVGALERRAPDGTLRWRAALDAPAAVPPLVHGGAALVADADGALLSVDLADGRERFRAHLGAVPAPFAASGGVVVLQERGGELHGFVLAAHDVAWSFGLDAAVYGPPAVWAGRVYQAGWSGALHCLSLRTGDELWVRPLPGAVTGAPVVARGRVWVATETGEVAGFDARDGRPVGRASVAAAPIQASPLPLDDQVIVAATDGTVAALGAPDA